MDIVTEKKKNNNLNEEISKYRNEAYQAKVRNYASMYKLETNVVKGIMKTYEEKDYQKVFAKEQKLNERNSREKSITEISEIPTYSPNKRTRKQSNTLESLTNLR